MVTKFSRRDADYEAKLFGSWGNQVPANGGTDPFVPSQQPIDNKNEDDLDWRQNLGRSEQSRPRIAPEDYFVIPPQYPLIDILGPRKSYLMQIQTNTGTWLECAYGRQIDMWGTRENIAEAKSQLNNKLLRIYELEEKTRRKVRGWAKPERALTDKERKRQERKSNEKAEMEPYLKHKAPLESKPFMGVFILPNQDIPISHIIGWDEEKLNEIRAQCKCHMWHEAREDAIKVAGDTKECVAMATMRIKNLFFTIACRPNPLTDKPKQLYFIDQPSENYKISFCKTPYGFETPRPSPATHGYRLLEPLRTGTEHSLQFVENLIELGEGDCSGRLTMKETPVRLPQQILTLNDRNANRLEQGLKTALERIRLFDYDIRMKIRFGQIYMMDYPTKNNHWTIQEIADKAFLNPKLRAELAPCMARVKENMDPLFEYLNAHGLNEYTDSPRTSFVIEANQVLEFVQPSRSRGNAYPSPRFDTRIDCSFKKDGKIGLWDCVTEHQELLTASMINLEKNYAWELKLESARRVPTDRPSPHGQLIHTLRLNKGNRLVYTNNEELTVQSVCQKTKWLFDWEENNYIIEICRDEIWNQQPKEKDINIEIDLATEPDKTMYKVSMYKDAWYNRFSENLNLGVGMAPNWTPGDFLHTEDENVTKLVAVAREFLDILTENLKRYWEWTPEEAKLRFTERQ